MYYFPTRCDFTRLYVALRKRERIHAEVEIIAQRVVVGEEELSGERLPNRGEVSSEGSVTIEDGGVGGVSKGLLPRPLCSRRS